MYRLFIILGCLAPVVAAAQLENPEKEYQRMLKEKKIDSIKVPVLLYDLLLELKHDDSIFLYTYTDTVRAKDGSYGIGQKTLGPNRSYLYQKVGDWTYYYPSGALFAKGSYGVGAKMICQAGGPNGSGYAYQSGYWQYWYPNGRLMAEGSFSIGKIMVATPFGGCDSATVAKPELNNEWKYYNKRGRSSPLTDTIRAAIFSPDLVR